MLMPAGGRLAYFYSTTSPLTLLASSHQLEEAQRDVAKFEGRIKESGRAPCLVSAHERDQYWRAKQCQWPHSLVGRILIEVVVNSSIHPDTNKPVPLPFRMSAFVPTNLM